MQFINHLKLKLLFLVILTTNLNAQTNNKLTGAVTDNTLPIEFATIAITTKKDTLKIVASAITDSLGKFYIKGLTEQYYILKINFIGYFTYKLNINFDSLNQTIDLKNSVLQANAKLLNTVNITSHKDLIKKTPQGFIVKAADNISQIGGTATDLLRNTPTVVVDAEGGITIRGKSPLILINGRNSGITSMDRIPASSIESIEIINNPSAQYDADAEGGIINITLKKNTQKGTNGSIALGAGYGAKGRFNSAFAINHQLGKFNLGLTYDNRFAARIRDANATRINYNIPLYYTNTQTRHDNRNEETHNLKFNLDYEPNDKNSISFEVLGNIENQHNNENLTTLITTQADTFNIKNTRYSDELGKETALEFALSYDKKFNNKRQKLSINLSSSPNLETEKTSITTQSLYDNDDFLGSPYLQKTSNNQASNVSNLKLDYSHPLGKGGTLETGYKLISRFTNANFKNLYYQNNDYVVNPKSSSIFKFKEQVHAVYAQYKNTIGKKDSIKWRYDIGLRAEQVYNQGELANQGVTYNRNYFNFFPTANLAYYINQDDFIKLSFTRRINRPSLGQLNPFNDITDSLNTHSGNPYLKPELINAAELGYNKEWKKVSFTLNVFYRYATNVIRPFISVQSNGVALLQPTNFGNATTYGSELIASVYPTNFWNFNASASIFQQHIDGSNVSSSVSNDVLSWYGKLINNFSLWKGGKLQLIGNYNSPTATPQGQTVPIYNVDAGFQQKLFKGKAALGLVITDVFNTQRKGTRANSTDFNYRRDFKIDTRAVLLTFAYSFGTKFKEELLENKFSND